MATQRADLLMALAANHDVLSAALNAQAGLIEALARLDHPDAATGQGDGNAANLSQPIPEATVVRRHRIPDLCDHPDSVEAVGGIRVCEDCGLNFS